MCQNWQDLMLECLSSAVFWRADLNIELLRN